MVDPLFRANQVPDFHLQEGSGLINAGDVNAPALPATDLDGKNRTVCGTIDIGAYQHHPHPPIALTTSASPTPGGGPITFTAQLTGNCNVPTGVVTFLDGGTPIGTGTLNTSGVATLTTSFLVVGRHNITTTSPGDFNFEDSTSAVLVQVITGAPTTTSLATAPNPVAALSPIVLKSLVHSDFGIPTGTVVFTANGAVLATAALDRTGVASATVSTLGAGTYAIVATYTADTLFERSTSPAVQEVVTGLDTATTLTATPNPTSVNQAVTFNTVVRAAQGNTNLPSGNVTLLDGAAVLGTAPLNASGVATFSITTLSFGTHTITARYSGSANFNPSSASLSEAVTSIATTLALTASPNPANTGQTVTLTATAASALPGTVPFGVVTFRDGTTVLATVPLSDTGVATFSTSTLAIGTHPLQATLAPTQTFAGSTSAILNETVLAYDLALTVSRPTLTLPSGDLTTITATLTPIGGFEGTVNLSCDQLPDHTQCIFPEGTAISLASSTKTVRLTINTSDLYGFGNQVSRSNPPQGKSTPMGDWPAAALFPFLSLAGVLGRKRRNWNVLGKAATTLTVFLLLLGIGSCSGKLPAKTAPGTYNLLLKGAAAATNMQHAAPIQLILKP